MTQILTQFVHGPLIHIFRVDDLQFEIINCCGIIRQSQKGMPKSFGKIIKLKCSDTTIRVTGGLTTMVWRDKCMLVVEYALAYSRGWSP